MPEANTNTIEISGNFNKFETNFKEEVEVSLDFACAFKGNVLLDGLRVVYWL